MVSVWTFLSVQLGRLKKLFSHSKVSLDEMGFFSRDLPYKIEGDARGKSRLKPLKETSLRVTQAINKFDRA